MASVLNRTTKAYRQSANTPDYPTQDWIHNPDMSAVEGFPSKYWIITGDIVTLMDQAARDAVDAAEAATEVTDNRTGAVEVADDPDSPGMQTRALVEMLVIIANYYATRCSETRTMVQEIQTAIGAASNLSQLKTAVAAIDTAGSTISNRTRSEVITLYKAEINSGGADS